MKRLSRHISLRTWLVLIVVVISGCGLSASAVVVSSIMRDFTVGRVDQDLQKASDGWAARNDFLRPDPSSARPPSDFYVQKMYSDGSRIIVNDSESAPDLSAVHLNSGPVTVGPAADSEGEARWRVMATYRDGVSTVVALNLNREDRIIEQLIFTQLTIGVLVLVILALIAYFVVRAALRPLRDVEKTAVAIAGGDLDRRIPPLPPTTEVGRLSRALNAMLGRLQNSVEEAQSQEQQMRRFVGDASHELRTPLTSVRGYTELYRSGAMPDADKVITKISDEASRMSYLVEDLLSLTRAEGSPMEMRKVDIFELSVSVVASMRAAHPGRKVAVFNQSVDEPLVWGDPQKLHRVALNLANNALVHGGADAAIEITSDEKVVCLNVRDNGIGMSPEVAEHVFERFYRSDSSRSRATGGSGLGLAIVKSLVEAHNGTVEVESTLGEGTVFKVCLPRLVEER
ncbi:HAMP domain-containing sensor histidine kinase [Corynebacterium sp. H128]|uniref:sensor histidine kinase n=1 Tax=unclassified Corynebacterium TaxID=2624378 RepID=UPI003095EDFE